MWGFMYVMHKDELRQIAQMEGKFVVHEVYFSKQIVQALHIQ